MDQVKENDEDPNLEPIVQVPATTSIINRSLSAIDDVSKAKTKRLSPNHFFAIQISDSMIVEGVEVIQKAVVEVEPRLKKTLIAASTLHITLAVLHLATSEDVLKANQVLNESGRDFLENQTSFHIHFKKVDHFNRKVVFAKICQEEDEGKAFNHLTTLTKILRERCRLQEIHLIDDDSFTPHLTLLKLSKDPQLRRKGIKTIPQELIENHAGATFGKQMVESIQLLSMVDAKDEAGYYAKKGEFHFARSVEKDLH